jgi:hypothetical protein
MNLQLFIFISLGLLFAAPGEVEYFKELARG